MSDYHDYADNLAFPPRGDWSDTQPKNTTDRTQSSCDMVDKIEKLTKQIEYMIKGFAWIRNENRFVDFGSKNKATVVLTTLAKDGYETAKQAVKEELEK